jgi:hypothetical protein
LMTVNSPTTFYVSYSLISKKKPLAENQRL